jgi:BsuBI/PstI restriction endonuclease domain/BsuBI/PstI restriction endonuclease HTH domain
MVKASLKKISVHLTETLVALEAMGVPLNGLSPRRREKMAKAVLALADLKPGMSWDQLKSSAEEHHLRSREVIAFLNAHWGEQIADSSYDDIRRKDLALPVEARLVIKSASNPDANTNDGTRGFAIDPTAAKVLRSFGTTRWSALLREYLSHRPALSEQFDRQRNLARVPVQMPSGLLLTLSAGAHNTLQKDIVEKFLPIFGFESEVLYIGDTEKKNLLLNEARLESLKFFELKHDKLPDVVAYSQSKNWLYLVEAVTTANPITELRRKTLLDLTQTCIADVILITAFPDRATYRKFAHEIAWETEVWIADAPEHMIHFNGDKFLGPYRPVS